MTVIILRGLPGAGKSTLALKLTKREYICSADHYFEQGGKYKFDSRLLGVAHDSCFNKFANLIHGGLGIAPIIVVDNTNTRVKEFKRYLDYAEKYGIKPLVFHVRPTISLSQMHERGVHNVPRDKFIEMYERWQDFAGEYVII